MKKTLIKSLLLLSTFFILAGCLGNAEPEVTEEKKEEISPEVPAGESIPSTTTSLQFVKLMKAGWNLGNTLDANSTGDKTNKGLDTETSWGMPKTTQAMINAVAEAGFKTIRIPVSWHNHITDANLTIDSAWLNRVKEIVDWALAKDMFVIINIHHDNLTSSDLKKTYGFTVNTDSTEQETSKKFIKAVWSQVASYFADYDNRLIFEVLNEPRDRDGENDGFAIPSNIEELNKVIASYNQTAVDAIRKAGNKNTERFLMLPYYATSPYDYKGWTLANDTASDKLIVSVHAYCPYDFCMNTADDSTFENDDEGNDINWLFSTIKNQWTSKGYGVVMGEASASDKNNTAERLKWFDYYYTAAKNNNVTVVLWDNMNISKASGGGGDINSGECHGYLNRNTLTWYFPALIKKIISITGK